MSGALPDRRLPFAAAARIAIRGGNRAAHYARLWLSLLGAPPADDAAASADIVIAAADTPADAPCVIRLWDFQVGREGGGALASAASGASAVIGHVGGPAVLLPADMPEKWCGAYGVILALAELWRRRQGARSANLRYDVSAADVMRAFVLQGSGCDDAMSRLWRRNGRVCVEHGGIFPMGFFACGDGHVAILGRSRRDWRQIRRAIGDPDWTRDQRFSDPFAIARDSAEADRLLERSLAAFSRDELLARALDHEAVIAPVYDQDEAAARHVFRPGFIADDGPAMPFVVEPIEGAGPTQERALPLSANPGPLSGLRCLEFCWVWSGPMAGQILADLGAEVIKLESPGRFDLYRTRGLETLRGTMPERERIESSIQFHSLNRNKFGVSVDLKAPAGLEIARRLAGQSDLAIENFTAGTMERLGLGPRELGACNPALTQLSMAGPGRGSAVEALRSYGLVLSALAGAESLIRDDDGFLGSPTFSLSDPNAATFAVIAALAGVLAAAERGQGQAIDLSQIEAAATLAGTPMPPRPTRDAVLRTAAGEDIAVSLPAAAARADPSGPAGPSADAIAAACAERGGRAMRVLELHETDTDEVFADCRGWIAAAHPRTGIENLVAAPWRVGGERPPVRKAAPMLGENDEAVLRHLLGYSDAAIAGLTADGVVGVPDSM